MNNNTSRDNYFFDLDLELLKNRTIFLSGEIDNDMASVVVSKLLFLDSVDNKEIKLYINSPGGFMSAGFAIYDTMQYVSADVSTIAVGMCYSMASILLAAGTRGRRFALPNVNILIHQPNGEVGGTATDIEIGAEQMKLDKKKVASILSLHTGQRADKIGKDILLDKYFTAEEAVKYGLIDDVMALGKIKQLKNKK